MGDTSRTASPTGLGYLGEWKVRGAWPAQLLLAVLGEIWSAQDSGIWGWNPEKGPQLEIDMVQSGRGGD